MVQYIFTPWRDSRELLGVRSQFYSKVECDDEERQRQRQREQRQHAVARVSMWMQRGGCPHLVDSTAQLTAAILIDGDTTDVSGSYAVRAAYSAAFSRFVTGLLDGHQDRARKMSMYGVAKSVGLPATFVELRHQATHEQLPSLTRLRAAANKALNWIWEYYWRHLPDVEAVPSASAAALRQAEADDAAPGGNNECRSELMSCLEIEDDAERENVLGDVLAKYGEGVVLTMLDGIAERATDTRVLRRAMGLVKDVLGREKTQEHSMEDGSQDGPRDVGELRAELGKAWEEVREIERDGSSVVDNQRAEKLPSWSLYDEEAWVPKPIGVV